jgi:hypothetical protein
MVNSGNDNQPASIINDDRYRIHLHTKHRRINHPTPLNQQPTACVFRSMPSTLLLEFPMHPQRAVHPMTRLRMQSQINEPSKKQSQILRWLLKSPKVPQPLIAILMADSHGARTRSTRKIPNSILPLTQSVSTDRNKVRLSVEFRSSLKTTQAIPTNRSKHRANRLTIRRDAIRCVRIQQ